MPTDAEQIARRDRLAEICRAYPETTAEDQHGNGHLSLEVAGKRFGYYLHKHRGDGDRIGVALKAARGAQEALLAEDPGRFWRPAYVGVHGWIGIRLDLETVDWDEVADFVRDAWMLTAPRRLVKALTPAQPGRSPA